jgi:import inner membrane translocase subunit TIM13
MQSANERCFKACITKPGSSLSSSEQTCLSRCLDRYMEACKLPVSDNTLLNRAIVNIVRRTYMGRLAKERLEDQANVI